MRLASARVLLVAFAVTNAGFTVLRDPNGTGPMKWSSNSITFRPHQAGSADVTDGSDLDAIRASGAAWSSVAGSALNLVDGGTTSTRASSCNGDGQVTISVFESWGYSSGIVAFTDHCRSGATITDADILVNGEDFTWATDGHPKRYDLQSTVTHELGHAIGLHHASHPEATMFCCGGKGLTYARTLHTDDEMATRYLYPSAAFSCSGDLDCPLLAPVYGPDDGTNGAGIRLICSGTSCAQGQAPYGADCYINGECASNACARISGDVVTGDDPGFCTQSCGGCPGGDLCSGGNCLLGRDDCVAANQNGPCTGTNVACTRDLDGRFRCNNLCYLQAHCGSVAGSTCWGGVSAQDAGFCLVPGATQTGACEDAFDCESLVCTTTTSGDEQCAAAFVPSDGGRPGGDSSGAGGDDRTVTGGDWAGGDVRGGDTARPGGDAANQGGGEPVSGGCGCRSGVASTSGPVWLIVGLVAIRRRRRV